MLIELKNIHHYPRMSEETECFDAILWIDGQRAGVISNRGHGGCDEFHGDNAAYDRANAWCKANLPCWGWVGDEARTQEVPRGTEGAKETDLESHIGTLLADHLVLQDMKRAMRTKVMFRKATGPEIWECRVKGEAAQAKAAEALTRQHPGCIILNGLPEAEALALYRTTPAHA